MSLVIAIDFDDTYTRDPKMWDTVIETFKTAGFFPIAVTARHEHQLSEVKATLGKAVGQDNVYCTNGLPKSDFMWTNHKVIVDVWVDDNPASIFNWGKRV